MPVFVMSNQDAAKEAPRTHGRPWYCMWAKRLWPYTRFEDETTLYWFDRGEDAIVWRSRVRAVERFPYANKDEVRHRVQQQTFRERVGTPKLNDPYFDEAVDQGYFLAFIWDSVTPVRLPRPSGFKFERFGWLDCGTASCPQEWRFLAEPDGPVSRELAPIVSQVIAAGYFSPATLVDERQRKLREIVQRRGQAAFRDRLITAYNGRCAVSRCDAVPALEAAHIHPYCGPQSDSVSNGLLLRSDIHTLYDLYLIGIHPEQLTIALSPALQQTCYADYHGARLTLPTNSVDHPSAEALRERWTRFHSS